MTTIIDLGVTVLPACDGCNIKDQTGGRNLSVCPVCHLQYCDECYYDPDQHPCQRLCETGVDDQ